MRICILLKVMYISVALAEYGDLRIQGGGSHGNLEFQERDGTWGAVCFGGFDRQAAIVACRQLGYDRGEYDLPTGVDLDFDGEAAVCRTNCNGNERALKDCTLLPCISANLCLGSVSISCYHGTTTTEYPTFTTTEHTTATTDYHTTPTTEHHTTATTKYSTDATTDYYYYDDDDDDDDDDDYHHHDSDSSSGGSSDGSIIGGITAVVVAGFIIFLLFCLAYVKYCKSQHRTTVITRRQSPRVFVARIICTRTVPSGPPPPPAYTPSAPDAGYTPVPARDHQPVPTTDYCPAEPTNTPSVAPNDIPSDPPPEYTPTVSTNVPVLVAPVNENSTVASYN